MTVDLLLIYLSLAVTVFRRLQPTLQAPTEIFHLPHVHDYDSSYACSGERLLPLYIMVAYVVVPLLGRVCVAVAPPGVKGSPTPARPCGSL